MTKKIKTVMRGLGFCANSNGSNPCHVDVDTEKNKIVRIRPFDYEAYGYTEEDGLVPWKLEARGRTLTPPFKAMSTVLSLSYKKRIYSKSRIPFPMVREDWDPKGERNTQNRGVSKYKRISWDEALDIMASEIHRVQTSYGPTSVLLQGDGHGQTETYHGSHGVHNTFMKLTDGFTIQARQPDSWEGWYWGAKHVWGMGAVGQQTDTTNAILDISRQGDAVLFWGCDTATTPLAWGGQIPEAVCFWFKELGIKNIAIAPDCNWAAVTHADKWIPVLPNTDAALQLAIAYVWITEGTYDKEHVETHTVGFDNFKYYVMGGEDGIPKTPKWAEKKCGVPSHTIKALARYWAKHYCPIAHGNGGCFIRSSFCHEPARLEVVLLAMRGFGKPDTGAYQFKFMDWGLFSLVSTNPLVPGEENPNISAAVRGRSVGANATSFIPKTLIPQALKGETIQWYGHVVAGLPRADQLIGPLQYPNRDSQPIHMIWTDSPSWIASWNNSYVFEETLRGENIEFIVAQAPWFENDCAFADLVLPVTSIAENVDITSDVLTGQFAGLFYMNECIPHIGESMSDTEIVCALAKRLERYGGAYENLYERYTNDMSEDDWLRAGFEGTKASEKMSWEEFKEREFVPIPPLNDWDKREVMPELAAWAADPTAQTNAMTTPSGKLEIYSTALAQKFPDDEIRGPIPRWIEKGDRHDDRYDSERARKYPFLLVSNHPHWRCHSQHDDVTWLREIPTCKVKGPDGYLYEPVWINPIDAARMGIKQGDIVKLFNERGAVLGGAWVTNRIIPGAVSQDHGAKNDNLIIGPGGLDRGGNNNLITPLETSSKNTVGQVGSGFLVGVEKVSLEDLKAQFPDQLADLCDSYDGLTVENYLVEEEVAR